ncbi:MAG: alpha/beta fold hydrolase [Actinomycetota bacterium]
MSEHHIEVDGRKVLIREFGNGAPIVLLHGFPQTGEAWMAVADRLAGRHRVIIPDLPGFGGSDPAPSASIADVGEVLLRALQANGTDKFALAGHDFGGSIAFSMALHHPEAVERLIVVNAPFREVNPIRSPQMLLFNVPLVPEALLTLAGRQLVPLMVKFASERRDMLDPETMKRYAASISDLGRARSALAYYRTSTRSAILRMLPIPGKPKTDKRKIEVPTLLVWGMKDRALPSSLIPGIRRDVENLEVTKLRDVGHFVPEEAPDELAHRIDHFILHPA